MIVIINFHKIIRYSKLCLKIKIKIKSKIKIKIKIKAEITLKLVDKLLIMF